jgi:hypothetical protein
MMGTITVTLDNAVPGIVFKTKDPQRISTFHKYLTDTLQTQVEMEMQGAIVDKFLIKQMNCSNSSELLGSLTFAPRASGAILEFNSTTFLRNNKDGDCTLYMSIQYN